MVPFGRLLDALSEVPDPRRAEGKRYPLAPLLLFTVLALLSGATSYRHIICFLEQRRIVLNALFGCTLKRAPSLNTLRTVLQMLDRDALDDDARAIAIERLLHLVAYSRLDFASRHTHRVLQANLGYDLPHRALGDLPDRVLRLGQFVEILLRIADVPAHLIRDIDQILVAGQHQRFLGRGAQVDLSNVLDIDLLNTVDWGR